MPVRAVAPLSVPPCRVNRARDTVGRAAISGPQTTPAMASGGDHDLHSQATLSTANRETPAVQDEQEQQQGPATRARIAQAAERAANAACHIYAALACYNLIKRISATATSVL